MVTPNTSRARPAASIVAVARFTPTDTYPPDGDHWEAFAFADRRELDAWLVDAGLWYPDALILDLKQPAVRGPTVLQ